MGDLHVTCSRSAFFAVFRAAFPRGYFRSGAAKHLGKSNSRQCNGPGDRFAWLGQEIALPLSLNDHLLRAKGAQLIDAFLHRQIQTALQRRASSCVSR